jgi:hypothetical protein
VGVGADTGAQADTIRLTSKSTINVRFILRVLLWRSSRPTDGVQPPQAGLSPTATYPPGRHPGRRPRAAGSAATIVRRPNSPAATGRNQATPATGAERADGRVGHDDFRARSLLSANEARERAMAGELLIIRTPFLPILGRIMRIPYNPP